MEKWGEARVSTGRQSRRDVDPTFQWLQGKGQGEAARRWAGSALPLYLWLRVSLLPPRGSTLPSPLALHSPLPDLSHRSSSRGTSQDYFWLNRLSYSFPPFFCYSFLLLFHLSAYLLMLPPLLSFLPHLLCCSASLCFLPPPGLIFQLSFSYSLLPRKGTSDWPPAPPQSVTSCSL